MKKFFSSPGRIIACIVCAAVILILAGGLGAYAALSLTGAITPKGSEVVLAETSVTEEESPVTDTDSYTSEAVDPVAETESVTSKTGSFTLNESTAAASSISLEEARAVALADAGLSGDEVTFTKAAADQENGISVYDFEFYTDSAEYEYEIRAANGSIYSKSRENRIRETEASTESSRISLDEAKAIALEQAGLSASEVTFVKAKMEKDDGTLVYEIEFFRGQTEYECTIDALTGEILEYDEEWDD
ncbi:MAG: PepSY domain-containing protein [Lachnospiraceae bacterium]|nr:PepSY domain-containing protein [Lachnospiraceae bacterium]